MHAIDDLAIRLDGVFDLAAARRIEEALGLVRPGGSLRVDVSQVRDFQDLGVAMLARLLLDPPAGVRIGVRGLRRHQLRLLELLGVDTACIADPLAGASLAHA